MDFRSDMAKGHPLYSAKNRKGAVVFGPNVYEIPLLPYERELIKTIGITEEEYQLFAAEVRRRGRLRPAEYDHIPDIVCEPKSAATIFLINLAVSLVLTGVAYLLTPKPKMPGSSKSGGAVNFGNITGANRFTPSRGFETLAELADYAAPIPLVFGLYDEDTGVGGMLVTPKLVWSRMFSHGMSQRAKLLFVVGEQGLNNGLNTKDYSDNPSGIKKPELQGIFLGNNALDHVFEDFFAFYWKPNSDFSRKISNGDRIYGTAGSLDSGDPDASGDNNKGKGKEEEVFLCPLPDESDASAFCHAYSPANSTQFGTYAPIANGTGYRLNYRIIAIGDDVKKKAGRLPTLARIKIAGDQNLFRRENANYGDDKVKGLLQDVRDFNQVSLGRNYTPRMGIVELIKKSDSSIITPPAAELKTTASIAKGDKIKFKLSASSIDPEYYQNDDEKGEFVDDINSSVLSMQLAADKAMQVGEKFSIAGSFWKVTSRTKKLFDPVFSKGRNIDQAIMLECIDASKSLSSKIGIISKDNVLEIDYIGDSNPDGEGPNKIGGLESDAQNVGEAFFPLTRCETAVVVNNRPAIVTEIGIKSIVYQKLNGLCSFSSLIGESDLRDYQEDNTAVDVGTTTATIMRASVFRLFIKKAGVAGANEDANPIVDTSNSLGEEVYFVVRGTSPVTQYNFIRIINPRAVQLEFEFVPVSSSELRLLDGGTQMIELLSSSKILSYEVNAGSLTGLNIQVVGNQITKEAIKANKEFMREPSATGGGPTISVPNSVSRAKSYPDPKTGEGPELGISLQRDTGGNISNNDDDLPGKMGAFAYDILGTASGDGIPDIKRTITQEIVNEDPYSWVTLRWKFRKTELPENHYSNETHTWVVEPDHPIVLGSAGNIPGNTLIKVKRGNQSTEVGSAKAQYPDTNPFIQAPGSPKMNWSGRRFRKCEETRKIDVMGGRNQGYYHEVFGAASGYGLGEFQTRRITEQQNNKTIVAELTSQVVESDNNFTGFNRRIWTSPTVKVVVRGTSNTWEVDEEFTHTQNITLTNPFRSSYSVAGAVYRINNLDTTAPKVGLSGKAIFAQQTQYSDISHYREFVEKSNANEPEHQIVYVNEIQENDLGPKGDSPSPRFNNLTLAGLSLKAGRNFTQLDQLRCWVSGGIQVERLHPHKKNYDGKNNHVIGASNLFTDLVYYLFTDQTAGAGASLGMTREKPVLLDKDAMIQTSKFLRANKLFFNGPIVERTNLRQFVMDLAPNFLCNFVISDGKFSLTPAVPSKDNGNIETGAITISQLFTGGNILEDTFKIEYLRSEERRRFKAIVRYRHERPNQLPEERSIVVKGAASVFNPVNKSNVEQPADEQFDLTQFCTSREHAVMVAKYFLSLRKLVTHTVSFSTTVHGLNLKAGSYIKVITESSPYSSANNGTVSSGGQVNSVQPLSDGQYAVTFFKAGSGEVDIDNGMMQVSNGHVQDEKFRGIIFTVRSPKNSENVYVVEQLTFSQEGTVDIVASEHPCYEDGSSQLADLVSEDDNFVVFD